VEPFRTVFRPLQRVFLAGHVQQEGPARGVCQNVTATKTTDGETGVGWRVGAARNMQMQAGRPAGRAACQEFILGRGCAWGSCAAGGTRDPYARRRPDPGSRLGPILALAPAVCYVQLFAEVAGQSGGQGLSGGACQ